MNAKKLPLIEIYGPHYQMGCQIGEACREQVKHSIDNANSLLEEAYEHLQLTWQGAQITGAQIYPLC